MTEILLQDKNYEFGIESGVGIKNTPWKRLAVRAKDDSNADKYVIDIRLNHDMPDFNETPVVYNLTSIEVNFHGYSNREGQTVAECIQTLNEAVAFAEKVQAYIRNMGVEISFVNK